MSLSGHQSARMQNDEWLTPRRLSSVARVPARDQGGGMSFTEWLQPHNGRDALRDAYEEALDLCAYLRQAIMERDGK